MSHVKSLYVEIKRDELEALRAEIERLRLNIADYNEHERCYQAEIAALKAQQSAGGVYSGDPLACSGCASGCFRCRSKP